MKYLFIDTNVYLSFYHFNNDDLGKLQALVDFRDAGKISIIVNQQLRDEFNRNRESKINDALSMFVKPSVGSVPRLFEQYKDRSAELRNLIKEANTLHAELIEQIKIDIQNQTLKADTTTKDIMGEIHKLQAPAILTRAKKRIEVGNPPGKKGSLGDAYHWEFLLEQVPNERDLIIVSDDVDWKSPLNPQELSGFLSEEWKHKKKSDVKLYTSISEYFKGEHPDIKLSGEYNKDLWIESLQSSASFDSSRSILRRLLNMGNLSDEQKAKLVHIACANVQVYRAHEYSADSIGGRLWSLIGEHKPPVADEEWKTFCERFVMPQEEISSS
jgi:hypothetical protein